MSLKKNLILAACAITATQAVLLAEDERHGTDANLQLQADL